MTQKTNRTRLQTLRALEECLGVASDLMASVHLALHWKPEVTENLCNLQAIVQDEIYSELKTKTHDWQLGFGEIDLSDSCTKE